MWRTVTAWVWLSFMLIYSSGSHAVTANYLPHQELQNCSNERTSAIVEVRINSWLIPEFQEIYLHNDSIWVPIDIFTYFVEGQALNQDGIWTIDFYGDDNPVQINLSEATIKVANTIRRAAPHCLFVANNNLYVNTPILREYFNLRLNFRGNEGYLDIMSGAPSPRDRRINREQKWQSLATRSDRTNGQILPDFDEPYGVAESLLSDISIMARNGSNIASSVNFNAFSTAEASALSHTLFLSGKIGQIDTARWTAERTSVAGNIFGVERLHSIKFGDISGLSSPMLGNSGNGTGISFQAAPVNLTDNFSRTKIEGDGIPGWDVELYVGGTLRAFQKISSNGRYIFKEIEISYGRNDIVVVLYGPNGEIEKIDYSQVVSPGMLPPGKIYAWGSIMQPNRSMLGIQDSNQRSNSGYNYAVRVDYGMSEKVSVSGFATRQSSPVSQESSVTETDFGGIAATIGLQKTILTTGISKNTQTNANAYYINTFIPQFLSGLSVSYEVADDNFDSSYTGIGIYALRQNLALSTTIPLPQQFGNIFATAERRTLQNNSVFDSLDLIYGHQLDALPITHYFSLSRQNIFDNGWGDTSGIYRAITSFEFEQYQFRAELVSSVLPSIKAEQLNVQMTYRKSDEENYSASYSYDFSGNNSLSLGFNRNFEKFALAGSLSANPEGYSASLRLGFSFGFSRHGDSFWQAKPAARNSRIKINAFNDRNYNSIKDPEEPWLSGLDIRVNNRFMEQSTDTNGEFILTGLQPNYPVNLEVGAEFLANNFQASTNARRRVIPRLGKITQFEVPVVDATILSGMVYYQHNDQQYPLSHATISLFDENGMKLSETISLNDGYYSIEGLTPGIWHVEVSTRRLDSNEEVRSKTKTITLEPGLFELDGVDFTFITQE